MYPYTHIFIAIIIQNNKISLQNNFENEKHFTGPLSKF